jgi:ABC-type sulfate/molybdate transport systems ATPase subunit
LILNASHKYGSTSLVVSHDMKSALKVADRILVLDQGKIIELATPKEIVSSRVPLVQDFLSEVLND